MVRRLYKRCRSKLSSLLGLPNIYGRLDRIEQSLEKGSRPIDLDEVAEFFFTYDLKIKDYLHAQLSELQVTATEYTDTMLKQPGFASEQHVNDSTEALGGFVRIRMEELADGLSRLVEDRGNEILKVVEQTRQELESDMKRRLDLIRTSSTTSSTTSSISVQSQKSSKEGLPDDIYQLFEDRFRGSEESVKDRLSRYLEFLPRSESGVHLVDLGCGRGEWLDLLTPYGFSLIGVDLNSAALAICEAKGLQTIRADALTYLQGLPEHSVNVVTAFHLIEHLGPREILDLVREISRVLKPGGNVILEFPNIFTLAVGASSFWLDPTHERPLHPLFLEFLLQEVGFTHVDVIPNSTSELHAGSSIADVIARIELNPDVTVIGFK